ncbi:MAG: hypothetical protein JSV03_11815, partial [Planctomycetota bacterium]
MAIRYRCECGANIRLPDNAVGRQAKCKTCGAIFTVPVDSISEDEPHWLDEFAKDETDSGDQSPVMMPDSPHQQIQHIPEPPPAEEPPVADEDLAYEDRDWIIAPEKPFWNDLMESFVFFMYPANLITLMFITFIHCLTLIIPTGTFFTLLSFLIFWGIKVFVYGYLCTFFMTVIVETAAGEDELPTVIITDFFDQTVMAFFRFIGSWALVLLPAILFSYVTWKMGYGISWYMVRILVIIGIFFWPVVVLCVAIGGGFRGLWPHVIMRTVLSAPLAYLAIWATLLVAAWLMALPATEFYDAIVQKLSPGGMSTKTIYLLALVNIILSTYAMIVAMRVIGLFY